MSLTLGKQFNRKYYIRIPFLTGFYNIGIFFNTKTEFLLFSVDANFLFSDKVINNKINMFKNLRSSNFCEIFIDLHNYKNQSLDIINQFKNINPEYSGEVSLNLTETLSLGKININNKNVYDKLNIYGFTINTHRDEFIFIIVERHHIIKRFNKKIVRTSGIQISTLSGLDMLNDYHEERKKSGNMGTKIRYGASNKIIKLNDV